MLKKLLFLIAVLLPMLAAQTLAVDDTLWTKDFSYTPYTVYVVKFSHDGNYIFAGLNSEIWQLETETGDSVRTFVGHTNNITNIDFSPTGDTLLSSSADGTVRLWNAATGDSLFTFYDAKPGGCSAYFIHNGKKVIAGASEKIVVWDIDSLQLVENIDNGVYNITISPDYNFFATASEDNYVFLWDLNTYEMIKCLGGHDDSVWDLAFSPDSKLLASCSLDASVKIWDVENRELLTTLYSDNGWTPIVNIAFSSDSKYIIYGNGGDSYTTQVWNIETGTKVYSYPFSSYSSLDILYPTNTIVCSTSKHIFLLKPI